MVRTILTGQLAAMNEAGDARGVAYVAGRLTSVLETIARREPPSRERIRFGKRPRDGRWKMEDGRDPDRNESA